MCLSASSNGRQTKTPIKEEKMRIALIIVFLTATIACQESKSETTDSTEPASTTAPKATPEVAPTEPASMPDLTEPAPVFSKRDFRTCVKKCKKEYKRMKREYGTTPLVPCEANCGRQHGFPK